MKFIHSDAAPAALGPYSQAAQVGQLLFVSGQLPLKDGRLIDDAAEATTAALTNLLSIVHQRCLRRLLRRPQTGPRLRPSGPAAKRRRPGN